MAKLNWKTPLKQRLMDTGEWGMYVRRREFYKRNGVNPMLAGKVSAIFHPPRDGSEPEIFADPAYAAIKADIANGKYEFSNPPEFEKFPNGATNFRAMKEATPEATSEVEAVKKAPKKYADDWQQLIAMVDPAKEADEVEIVRWAFNHCGLEPQNIDPNEVPCVGVVRMLKHGMTDAGYRDVLAAFLKLMPDRKALEYTNRFKDDGQELFELFSEFERSMEPEEVEDAA